MRWNFFIKGFLICASVAFIIACSPKSNYKLLSVFFDGVPDPYKADSIAKADSIRLAEQVIVQQFQPASPEFVFHPPYKEKDCAGCHDQNSMGKLLQPMPALCYQCHEDFKDRYDVLHGPVDAGFCTECHNPHMHKNEKLLLRTGQELCLYCHRSEDVFINEDHADIEDADCTDCHNPHGGEDRYIFN